MKTRTYKFADNKRIHRSDWHTFVGTATGRGVTTKILRFIEKGLGTNKIRELNHDSIKFWSSELPAGSMRFSGTGQLVSDSFDQARIFYLEARIVGSLAVDLMDEFSSVDDGAGWFDSANLDPRPASTIYGFHTYAHHFGIERVGLHELRDAFALNLIADSGDSQMMLMQLHGPSWNEGLELRSSSALEEVPV
jgi:hypothetical protein